VREGATVVTSFRFEEGVDITGAGLWPNVELTGRQRQGALAVRQMMNQNCRAAKVTCRWRSG
jgi:hypothetical protein